MPDNLTHVLHFTIGPVQGFVSQARRTRDFWAGSFLLSYLSATAMRHVQGNHGEIVFPEVSKDQTMLWLAGKGDKDKIPTIGTAPNRFKAKVSAGFSPSDTVDAVKKEWQCIARAVRENDLHRLSDDQLAIWNRQIDNFWDIAWVMVPEGDDHPNLLDRRKNWRTFMPKVESGDKCTVMGELQELSGYEGPNREKQDALLWNDVRACFFKNKKWRLDLGKDERLSAVAFVKRRFMHEHIWRGLQPGWTLPYNVPSVSYMAAVNWLENVIRCADKDKLEAFSLAASKIAEPSESRPSIACIVKARAERHDVSDEVKKVADRDGGVFFKTELENDNNEDFADGETEEEKKSNKDNRVKTLKALNALARCKDDKGMELGHPTPFYAVLLMDGDKLGAHLFDPDKDETIISTVLAQFTEEVQKIVPARNGFLVYAGGDDVLALMPLEDALPCAFELKEAYEKAASGQGEMYQDMHISAAIVYAHIKLPLTAILKDAHGLLDKVAKDFTGRDAVACRVWKRGGVMATWAMPWCKAVDGHRRLRMEELVKGFQKRGKDSQDPGYASKFLYKIRPALEALNEEGKDIGNVLDIDYAQRLLVTEYMDSGLLKDMPKEKRRGYAEKMVRLLLSQCRVFKDGNITEKISADGAMLLRFLAQKGVE